MNEVRRYSLKVSDIVAGYCVGVFTVERIGNRLHEMDKREQWEEKFNAIQEDGDPLEHPRIEKADWKVDIDLGSVAEREG